MPQYLRNRPTASELLSDSQSMFKNNFNLSDDSFGIDHYQFSDTTSNNGMHKIIHQTVKDNSGNTRLRSGAGATTVFFPGAVANIEQVFAANYTPDTTGPSTDTQLFAFTGNGGLSQLTGNLASGDGWCWVGGILVQWGFVAQTTSAPNQTTLFKDRVPGAIPFPNNCFMVTATIAYNGALDTNKRNFVFIERNNGPSPSKTKFKWSTIIEDSSSVIRGFFWWAVGN